MKENFLPGRKGKAPNEWTEICRAVPKRKLHLEYGRTLELL